MTNEITFVADGLTPVLAYAALREAGGDCASFLFESVIGGERWGRYSIVAFAPTDEWTLFADGWRSRGCASLLRDDGDLFGRASRVFRAVNPIVNDVVESRAASLAQARFGFVAYDVVSVLTKVEPWAGVNAPLARFFGGATIVLFDSLRQCVTIAGGTARERNDVFGWLTDASPLSALRLPERTRFPSGVTESASDEAFSANVRRVQEYIGAGDAFQVVLARSFYVAREGRDPFDVYRSMRVLNPSPYMYYLDLPPADGQTSRTQIAGASPETLVRLLDSVMTVRPIAGTRPRGQSEAEDNALAMELLGDAKERAEHLMLIDLGRNDVSRVSEVGSVNVVRQFEIERYSHVMHLVSEVQGRVRKDVPPLDVLRAAFPAGTLSGAPKVRAMQIIRELESGPRGIYGGAVGYMGDGQDLDFAIAIRTAVCYENTFTVTAGAGIVEASSPQAEADETRSKARGVLCAIENAATSGCAV